MATNGKQVEENEDGSYEDASENVPIPATMDLRTGIQETITALNLFLNNKFSEARSRMEPWADKSMYHALGYGTIMYLQAAMTFETVDIEAAVATVKTSVTVCNKFRKRTGTLGSITKAMTKTNYDDYTEEELHAELCYAECLIERALLTFIQDENLISFVRGSLKIRDCNKTYKECQKILDKRNWKDSDEKLHFESGVRLGTGLFNLMISLLPTKILKLLEFVGFSGNKKRGLNELGTGAALERSLRGPLCSLTLIAYHTVVTYVLGTADGDIDYAESLLQNCLKQYPKGALFLFFAGRIEEIRGNLPAAILRFEESVDCQSEWRQFHHLCFWELMWCHSFAGDWLLAMKYAEKLCRESKWSRATYTYQKASFLMMCDEKDITEDTEAHINYLMEQVPKLKQRIAGKSIPIEKFAVKKAKRYADQGNRLTLPAYELIYVWNGFSVIGKKPEYLAPMMTKVEETINEIVQNKDKYLNYEDDYCLTLLLKGVCLRCLGRSFQAEQCFQEIITLEKQLKQDHYLVPYATLELATLRIQEQELEKAKDVLHKAKHHYKGYSLESRLHFRIHAANLQVKTMMNQDSEELASGGDPSPDGSPVHSYKDVDADDSPSLLHSTSL